MWARKVEKQESKCLQARKVHKHEFNLLQTRKVQKHESNFLQSRKVQKYESNVLQARKGQIARIHSYIHTTPHVCMRVSSTFIHFFIHTYNLTTHPHYLLFFFFNLHSNPSVHTEKQTVEMMMMWKLLRSKGKNSTTESNFFTLFSRNSF